MRNLVTILGFAATTAAATLAVCWPGRTYADPPETFYESGSVDDVTFSGEVARDTSLQSGWAIKVTYENRGDEDETCQIDTELTRTQVNPALAREPAGARRVAPQGQGHRPGARERREELRGAAWMAVQLTSNEKATTLREKVIDRENEKPNPNYAISMRPYTMYSVAFLKADG